MAASERENGRGMAVLERENGCIRDGAWQSTAELERAQLGMPGYIFSLHKPSHLKCLISASHHKVV